MVAYNEEPMTRGVKNPVIPSPICILSGKVGGYERPSAKTVRDVRERVRTESARTERSPLVTSVLNEEEVRPPSHLVAGVCTDKRGDDR